MLVVWQPEGSVRRVVSENSAKALTLAWNGKYMYNLV
jgi:hypothetical protein